MSMRSYGRAAVLTTATALAAAALAAFPAASAYATTVSWTPGETATSTGSIGPAAPGDAITTSQMISRADDWMQAQVPYSQSNGWQDAGSGGPYREDCSGFVSMAWGLSPSLVTSTLPQVATVTDGNITGDTNLNPGDALDYPADHVVLFDSWINKSAGTFNYDAEHTYGQVTNQSQDSIYDSTLEGFAISDFEALRYSNIKVVSPPPTTTVDSPTGPAVSNPLAAGGAGDLEVYGTMSNGTLDESYWNSSSGWHTNNLGGSITGVPTAVYNPIGKDLEVYATGTNGTLQENYWNSSGWHTNNLGGSITGSPSAVYNPIANGGAGDIEVYATGKTGALEEIWWNKSSGWSSWSNLAGSITGSPSALFNKLGGGGAGDLEVYATSTTGTLQEYYWNASGWHTNNLNGTITGSPAAIYNPIGAGDIEIYAAGSTGSLDEVWWNGANGWSSWHSLGGSIIGSPTAVFNPAADGGNGDLEVYASGSSGSLDEYYWNATSGWNTYNPGGSLTGSPYAIYNPVGDDLEVYSLGTTGSLNEDYWSPADSWRTQDNIEAVTLSSL
jgi:hypothetical protein